MSNFLKDIFVGFKESPIATLCLLLVCGFAWIYNDLTAVTESQREFMHKMHESQVLMNKSLHELNVRMSNIEQNFQTTPQQLKELILLLHHEELKDEIKSE